MNHLYLSGFMGAGKTTVGRLLAQKLSLEWIDLDHWIESRQKMKISDIFQNGGESRFRDLETQELRAVALRHTSVVSLGGGAILRSENRSLIQQSGHLIYLRAQFSTLLDRLIQQMDSRPLLAGLRVEELGHQVERKFSERRHLYEMANYTIDTDTERKEDVSPAAVVDQIIKLVGGGRGLIEF